MLPQSEVPMLVKSARAMIGVATQPEPQAPSLFERVKRKLLPQKPFDSIVTTPEVANLFDHDAKAHINDLFNRFESAAHREAMQLLYDNLKLHILQSRSYQRAITRLALEKLALSLGLSINSDIDCPNLLHFSKRKDHHVDVIRAVTTEIDIARPEQDDRRNLLSDAVTLVRGYLYAGDTEQASQLFFGHFVEGAQRGQFLQNVSIPAFGLLTPDERIQIFDNAPSATDITDFIILVHGSCQGHLNLQTMQGKRLAISSGSQLVLDGCRVRQKFLADNGLEPGKFASLEVII